MLLTGPPIGQKYQKAAAAEEAKSGDGAKSEIIYLREREIIREPTKEKWTEPRRRGEL